MAEAFRYSEDLDEAGALGLALADLLRDLEYARGKRIKATFETYAEPEDIQKPPAVVVLSFEGDEDAGTMTPIELAETWNASTGQLLVKDGEFTADAQILIWATDPRMRSRLVRAVRERLIDGTGDRARRLLDVPRYFGGVVRAVVEPKGRPRFEDSEDDAKRRHRLAYLTVGVQLDMLRIRTVPALQAGYTLTQDDVPRTR